MPIVSVVAHAQSLVIADIIAGEILALNVLVVVTSYPVTFAARRLNIVCARLIWLAYHCACVLLYLRRLASVFTLLIYNTSAKFDSSDGFVIFRLALAIDASPRDIFIVYIKWVIFPALEILAMRPFAARGASAASTPRDNSISARQFANWIGTIAVIAHQTILACFIL